MNFKDLTLKQTSESLAKKEISAMELATSAIERVKEVDGKLHAFLKLTEDKAFVDARVADEAIKLGTNTPLTGIPYALKDNILAKGIQATAGSKILENYIAAYDSTVAKRLAASAPVLIGKTNLDEFAM